MPFLLISPYSLFLGIPGGDASVCCDGVHGGRTPHRRRHGDRDEGALDSHGLQGGCPGHPLPSLQEYSPQRHQGWGHTFLGPRI